MSTIVFRDGIMAADTRGYGGGNYTFGVKTKVRCIGDLLVGVTTTALGTGERFFRAIADGYTIDEYGFRINELKDEGLGAYTVLVVDKDWNAYLADDKPHFSGPARGPYFAIGSGANYAMGAMRSGACAVDAIRAATELDVWSALPIDAVKHTGQAWRVAV